MSVIGLAKSKEVNIRAGYWFHSRKSSLCTVKDKINVQHDLSGNQWFKLVSLNEIHCSVL
jgi:hypothetical protein